MNKYILKYKLLDVVQDVRDFIAYDILKSPEPKSPELPSSLELQGHTGNGFLWVEAEKYPGFIASGRSNQELREAIFDSMLRYFNVPRHIAKKIPDQFTLTLPNGKTVNPPIKDWSFKARLVTA
jgi:hypothetical protein